MPAALASMETTMEEDSANNVLLMDAIGTPTLTSVLIVMELNLGKEKCISQIFLEEVEIALIL